MVEKRKLCKERLFAVAVGGTGYVAAAGESKTIYVFKVVTESDMERATVPLRHLYDLKGVKAALTALEFSKRDGGRLFSVGWDRFITIWSLTDFGGRFVSRLLAHSDKIYCCALSDDGRLFATGGGDYTTRVWLLDDATGGLLSHPVATLNGESTDKETKSESVWALAWTTADEYLIATGYDAALRVYRRSDADEFSLLATVPEPRPVHALALTPARDGTRTTLIATAGQAPRIAVYAVDALAARDSNAAAKAAPRRFASADGTELCHDVYRCTAWLPERDARDAHHRDLVAGDKTGEETRE